MKSAKKDNGFKISIVLICVLSVITASCCGYIAMSHFNSGSGNVKDAFTFLYDDSTTEPEDTTSGEAVDAITARLMCAGENLIYNTIYNEAKERATDGGYDFSYLYKNVKDIIGEADLAMINQSTVISDNIAVSSAPNFCSPTAFGDALCDAGFNVINLSGKHIWDKGESGAKDTLAYWNSKSGVFTTGLSENESDMTTAQIKEVNGIKFAFISFSTDINGYGYSSQSNVHLLTTDVSGTSQIDFYNNIKDIIKDAKEKADVTVVSVNFDSNNAKEPSTQQQSCINYLVSFGADVIIGTGTDSVQPIEVRDNGSSKTVIAYSLGSFMSAKSEKESMLSSIADIVYSKNAESGEVKLESARFIPTVTMIEPGNKNHHVVAYTDLDVAEAKSHPVSGFNAEFAEDYFTEVIPDKYMEKNLMDTEDLLGTLDNYSDSSDMDDYMND